MATITITLPFHVSDATQRAARSLAQGAVAAAAVAGLTALSTGDVHDPKTAITAALTAAGSAAVSYVHNKVRPVLIAAEAVDLTGVLPNTADTENTEDLAGHTEGACEGCSE